MSEWVRYKKGFVVNATKEEIEQQENELLEKLQKVHMCDCRYCKRRYEDEE